MPCGPLQTMQIYALGTGSLIAGALSMFFFSIGTVPLMFGLGAISTFISNKSTKLMIKISAIIIIILGFNMLSRGILLSGIENNFNTQSNASTTYSQSSDNNNNNDTSSNNTSSNGTTTQNSGIQEIHSTLTSSSSYPTITVKVGIPVKWTISAEKKYLNGCNGEISIPKYNITKELNVGDTVIEFTPKDVGNFAYSCWMGMVRGKIKVVPDDSSAQTQTQSSNKTSTNSQNDDYIDTTGLPSCCKGF